ncbi:MAG: DUF3106 domain-containing protein [Rubrivivax sp.]|nr:DUF3106 domain-containing protein [Rubrivivax sp.]
MNPLRWLPALLAGVGLSLASLAWAAEPSSGSAWAQLSAAQRQALAPLERDWARIDEQRRSKWLEVAARFPTMPADERQRLQQRMADWARMTPAERGSARLQFQEARGLSPDEREAKWQAYQALPDTEREALADRAKRPAKAAALAPVPRSAAAAPDAPAGKRNLVESSAAVRPRAANGTAQQARPGATTTPITTARPSPPAHNQAGLPKIAATPGFVDSSTLLPKRGPQGAAVRSTAAVSAASAASATPSSQ